MNYKLFLILLKLSVHAQIMLIKGFTKSQRYHCYFITADDDYVFSIDLLVEESSSSSEDMYYVGETYGRRQASPGKINADSRVIQYNILFVTGLPSYLINQDILTSHQYFGKYGKIEKVVISNNYISIEQKMNEFEYNNKAKIYITYEDENDASFALAALNGISFDKQSTLKINYGTVQFCPMFLQGKLCYKKNCYFYHSKYQHFTTKSQLKKTTELQIQRAYQVILDNMNYYLKKQYNEFVKEKDHQKSKVKNVNHISKNVKSQNIIKFPSIKQTFEKLINLREMQQNFYDKMKMKLKIDMKLEKEEKQSKNIKIQSQKSKNIADDQSPESNSDKSSQKQEPMKKLYREKSKNKSKYIKYDMLSAQERTNEIQKSSVIFLGKILEEQDQNQIKYIWNHTNKRTNNHEQRQDPKSNKTSRSTSKSDKDVQPVETNNEMILERILKIIHKRNPQLSRLEFTEKIPFEQLIEEEKKIKQIMLSVLVYKNY